MATELELNVVTTSEDAGLRGAADDLEKVKRRSDEVGHSFEESGRQSHSLDAEIDRLRKHLHGLNTEYATTGDKALFKDISRDRRALANLERIAKDIGRMVETDVVDSFSEIGDAARNGLLEGKAVLIGGAVGLAATLAPAIGAVVAGALTGSGIGIAMAGGILSATKSPEVKSAAQKFLAEIESDFFLGGNAFVGPIKQSLDILAKDVHSLDLADVFAKAAPYVTLVATGIGDLVKNFMPGLNKALDKAGPYSEVFAKGLADTGSAFGSFMADVAESPGALEGLVTLFRITDGVIVTLGQGLRELSGIYAHMIDLDLKLVQGTDAVVGSIAKLDIGGMGGATIFHKWLQGTATNLDAIAHANENATAAAQQFTQGSQLQTDVLAQTTMQTNQAAHATDRYRTSLQDLNKTVDDSINTSFRLWDAETNLKQAELDLTKSLKENGKTWDTNTQAGINNTNALKAALEAAKAAEEAQIAASNGSVAAQDAATKAYDATVKSLLAQAAAAGADADQLKQLAGTYVITIHTRSILETVGGVTGVGGGVYDLGDLANQHKAQHRAYGGSVMAGMPYIVNERANKEVYVPKDGWIGPANLAPAGGTQKVVLQLDFTGLEDEFAKAIRKSVRIRGGGNVQVAFGS